MKKILIGILAIAVIILGYVAFKSKDTDTNTSPTPITPSDQTSNNPTAKDSQVISSNTVMQVQGWKTYSNTKYGFSFNYPSNWKLTENAVKKEVTIDTNDIAGVNPENRNNPQYPSWSITFTATDKTFFTQQHISTKMGEITYDESTKALMADGCLKAAQLFGDNPPNVNNTSSIQSIIYGGSSMSEPAYSNSAILTSNGEIIIVYSQQGTAATPEVTNVLSKIASSFALLNGNTVFVPACAK